MAPQVVLIRHAQALHNVDKDYALKDPSLSELGVQQLSALKQSLSERFGNLESKDVALLTSPMRRCIQTALGSAGWLLEKGVVLTADADWQENSSKPCDTGSDPALLAAEFPQVDFTALQGTGYPDKTSPTASAYYHTRSAILERGLRALSHVYKRPEKVVLVFSHSGFLRCGCVGWWFHNSDYRVFEFQKDPAETEDWSKEALMMIEGMGQGGLGLSWEKRVELGDELPEQLETETREFSTQEVLT